MRNNLARLAERRERLIAQAAAQRTALAESTEPWRAPLAMVDRGLAIVRAVKRQPAWMVGGFALLALLLPGPAGKWLRRGWTTWQVMHKLRGG